MLPVQSWQVPSTDEVICQDFAAQRRSAMRARPTGNNITVWYLKRKSRANQTRFA
jgi:hypothetical protein